MKLILIWSLRVFLIIVVLSIIITIVTLWFDDYKPEVYSVERIRAEKKLVTRDSQLDKVIDEMLAQHPEKTGMILLDENLEAFAMRVLATRVAERTIDLQYYIWNSDLTGRFLGGELIKAADRGVKVRVILDDLNSLDKDNVLAAMSNHPNIELRMFNPVHSRQNIITRSVEFVFRGLSLNRRMHNKAWIVDDNIAIIGGRNIGNEYFDADLETNFFDVDVLLIGKSVAENRRNI